MALANYTDILASVASWMDRDDLTTQIPDFVALAEARISRDLRIRRQVLTTSLTTTASVQTVSLPATFLEIENMTITSVTPQASLSVVTPEVMDRRFPASYQTGQPQLYSILGDNLYFGPTPDTAYTVELHYYARFDPLATTATNWLLTNHPMVYLAGAMCEGWLYLMDADKVALWDSRYRAEVKALQETDDSALRSGSEMRVRAL